MTEQPGAVDAPARTRRARSPRGQGDRLRAEILAATGRLLERLGSEQALSLRAVAREVGIAAPSVYLHFADKNELVWATLAEANANLAGLLDQADAGAGDDPVRRLRAQAHAYCRFGMDFPGHYRLMYATTLAPVSADRLRDHPARLVLAPLARALARCDRGGPRLRLPVDRAVVALWSGLHGITALWRTMPDPSQSRRVYSLADDLLVLLLDLPAEAFTD